VAASCGSLLTGWSGGAVGASVAAGGCVGAGGAVTAGACVGADGAVAAEAAAAGFSASALFGAEPVDVAVPQAFMLNNTASSSTLRKGREQVSIGLLLSRF